ncbi:MAG: SWIM zinc finger family protein [Methanosarcinales archaeon]|nr:SWIM zinc finger family protein [Methanosarcinales archaeon]
MGRRGYWDYYHYTPAKPKEVKDGIKAKSKRGAIGETWWSKRWIDVLESFNMGARLTRGKSYARKGQVISIDVSKGIVDAKVQGTGSKPYEVTIGMKPISEDDWEKVTDTMASKAIFAAKLLSGEMPTAIEDAFAEAEVSLFPAKKRDLKTDCSCPDSANPCKHIAAVYYLLAERFDDDPFLIFKLRGRTKEEIIGSLRRWRAPDVGISAEDEAGAGARAALPTSSDEGAKPLDSCLDCFWEAGVSLDSFSVKPAPPAVVAAILKRLGDAPYAIGKDNISALLVKVYEMAGKRALQMVSGESDQDLEVDM